MENALNFTLLLTACIEPKQFIKSVKRSDPYVRLNDYKIALTKWLHHKDERITKIIFAENSGFPLDEIMQIFKHQNIYNREILVIQEIAKNAPAEFHYGYNEIELIQDVIFKHLSNNKNEFIIKVTGRIFFPSISKLLNKFHAEMLFIADSRKIKFLSYNRNYVLTNLFVCNVDFFKNYLTNISEVMRVNGIKHLETVFMYVLFPLYLKDPMKIKLRFPVNIDPIGIGAHWNVNYQSFTKVIGSTIRGIARKFISQIWL